MLPESKLIVRVILVHVWSNAIVLLKLKIRKVTMKNSEILDALKLNIDILYKFIISIPEEAIMKRRKDYWTIYEHLEHMVVTQDMLYHRIDNFIKEEEPVIKPYNPEDKPKSNKKRTVKELLEAFSKWRNKQVGLIESCDDEIWEKTAEHPEYDQYSFETMVRHVLLHDGFHMYRIEELWLVKDEYVKPLQ
jgi:hypothetical protein